MPQQPKILLIGDSISIGYAPHVAKELEGEYRLAHNVGNAGDSGNLLAKLDDYLAAEADADLVHFNCGLHDIKRPRDGSGPQVPLQNYRENLTRIVDHLKAKVKHLIWASTTPVIHARHKAVKSFDRHERDVLAYNAVAAEIVTAAGIPINDLHAETKAAGKEKLLGEDGVHFTAEGYAFLAYAVAAAIRSHCPRAGA